ncbi:uncharacterized protein [Triticum aestivum]|uniref:uncharacterized protein isoform X2 n=1 Tax=Triticum aestivum TaxID=4565 RepID=UPI001ABD2208|nr:uncharacterized protein LOC109779370 [Aegilops tauschii subsp. strangulata]XP_044451813.1 uncharacterized protein LOC123183140 isoform X2 [Triticum aestivum]
MEQKNIVGRLIAILDVTKDIIYHVNEIRNDKKIYLLNERELHDVTNHMTYSITYSTVALEILENLCTHCTLDKDCVKEALLPKVLMEVLDSRRDLPRNGRKNSSWDRLLQKLAKKGNRITTIFKTKKREENQAISRPEDDEENQTISGPGDHEENRPVPKRRSQINSPEQSNEEKNAKREFQEALLSLTWVMCDKLINAGDFDDVAREIALGEGEFAWKLTDIVQENCEATADCLRIVKLCGQIAILMLKRGQDTAQLKECVDSLQKASKIMSSLESCMLFAGTDCGVKKTARPLCLLSDVAKEARELVEM